MGCCSRMEVQGEFPALALIPSAHWSHMTATGWPLLLSGCHAACEGLGGASLPGPGTTWQRHCGAQCPSDEQQSHGLPPWYCPAVLPGHPCPPHVRGAAGLTRAAAALPGRTQAARRPSGRTVAAICAHWRGSCTPPAPAPPTPATAAAGAAPGRWPARRRARAPR